MKGVGIAEAVPGDAPHPTAAAPDARPFIALGLVLLALAAAFAVPASRAWLDDAFLDPLRAQVEPMPTAERVGYTFTSLMLWAALGAAFAWAAYETVFVRLRIATDRRFFLALAPYLLFGPLLHALLVADALPTRGPLAYAAAEPPVYLTTGVLAVLGFAAGAALQRPYAVAAGVGAIAVLPLVALAFTVVEPANASRAAVLVGIALASALAVALVFHKMRPRESFAAVFAVVGAHALDGTTTWMVLRDPLGLGFHSFAEKNPVSLALVQISNGWPYFALKLVLPVLLLLAVRVDEGQDRLQAFLLLAVFVLGYGPGMSNLLQVLFG